MVRIRDGSCILGRWSEHLDVGRTGYILSLLKEN